MTSTAVVISSPTAKTKSRPFKKFYCDDKTVFTLPPVAFKLWMYHYAREGKDRKSWPSIDTICEALQINKDTAVRWRKYLVEHGWMEKVGERLRNGEFAVPEYRVRRGTVSENFGDGRTGNRIRKLRDRTVPKKSDRTVPKTSDTDRSEKIGSEVDSLALDTGEEESGVVEEANPAPAPSSSNHQTHGHGNATPKADPEAFVLWLIGTFDGLALNQWQRKAVAETASRFDIGVLKASAQNLMVGRDPRSSWDKCGELLEGSLADQCKVVVRYRLDQDRQEKLRARQKIEMRAQAEAEIAAVLARRDKEEIEETL